MDTADLSDMAYQTLRLAESINHTITVDLGVMVGRHKTEDTFLKAALSFVRTIIRKPQEYIDSWGLEDEIRPDQLVAGMKSVEAHITATLAVPIAMREDAYF